MAEKILNTRIRLKYDTLANWLKTNPVLLEGEIAVVAIPKDSSAMQVEGTTPPEILFKVGDGTSNFSALQYSSAKAADVHAWAKAATKPSYTKDEVGLANVRNVEQYSKTEVDQIVAEINSTVVTGDTDTKYQLVQNGTTLKLQSKGKTDAAWSDVAGQSFDLASILGNTFAPKELDEAINVGAAQGYAGVEYTNLADAVVAINTQTNANTMSIGAQGSAIASMNRDLYGSWSGETRVEPIFAKKEDIPTELGVMDVDGENAIEVTGDADKVVKLKINSNKGNVTLEQSTDGLRANVDLSSYEHSGVAKGLIEALDVIVTGMGAGKTLASLTETDGKIDATFQDISITESQISNFGSYIPTSQKGAVNGVATLGADGKVPTSQLPSYVDDVLTYANKNGFPSSGETGKIYVAEDTNLTYRWSGTAYVEISASLALGETSATAYAGDKGKALAERVDSIEDNYLPLSGGTMTGHINLDSFSLKGTYQGSTKNIAQINPTDGLCLGASGIGATIYSSSAPKWTNGQGVRKTFAMTDALDNYLPLTGGTITGDLKLNTGLYFKQSPTETYTKVLGFSAGKIELGTSSTPGVTVAAAHSYGIALESAFVKIGPSGTSNDLFFQADPTKVVKVGRTDYSLQFRGSAAPTWTDGTSTKTVAMTSDIPTNVVQYYEANDMDEEEEVFIFCCGSASKLV